jgi:hypothetical protein
MKRKNLVRKMAFTLLLIACGTILSAQESISIEKFGEQYTLYQSNLTECFANKNYIQGEETVNKIIVLFEQLSESDQQQYQAVQANNYYNLACFYSLQNKKQKALDAFEKGVKEYGYINYAHANTDSDLDNIRKDKRFIKIMESIREIGDYKNILRQAEKYVSADTTGLPHFHYEKTTNNRLQDVKKLFNLDSIAGQGDEISKIINLMTWVHNAIRHDGSNYALCEFDAVDFYNYYKATGKGINCRGMSITLNECYLAMGFQSRFMVCLPKNDKDIDCHVINCVYSTTLGKWLWMDPSFNAYVKDENGNLLSIEEVRERLINDQALVLNADANHNNEEPQTKEYYLDSYMSKNLYWLQCSVISKFNQESRYRSNTDTYVSLVPPGFQHFNVQNNDLVTSDPAYFWQKP